MKRCHCCQERFGLIRHHYNRLQFCSAICVASYRATLRQAINEKVGATDLATLPLNRRDDPCLSIAER
jgi:hypothetical protein